jgi:hypothetical protein
VHVTLLKVPAPLLAKRTVPLGLLCVPLSVSLTVAVHVVGASTGTVLGVQLTLVLVERLVAVTVSSPEEPRWVLSPP